MARNGKIARLPLHVRNELNRRLSEGEPGTKLVAWLNEGSARIWLRNDSEGRPIRITEQNLSEWRQGGYQDWLRHEEARQFTQDLAEQAGELDAAADGKGISDRFGALLAVDLARLAKKFLEQETDAEKKWERLKEISKELSRLRRDEHRAVRTWIKREQWERQRGREDYEEAETIRKEVRREQVAPLLAAAQVKGMAAAFGDGPGAQETAAMILEAQQDLEPGCLVDTVRAQAKRPKVQGRESGRIKPNPTKSNQKKPQGVGQSIQVEGSGSVCSVGIARCAVPGGRAAGRDEQNADVTTFVAPALRARTAQRTVPTNSEDQTRVNPSQSGQSIKPNPTKSDLNNGSKLKDDEAEKSRRLTPALCRTSASQPAPQTPSTWRVRNAPGVLS